MDVTNNFDEYRTTIEDMSPGSPDVRVNLQGKYTPGVAVERQETLILSSKESSLQNYNMSKKQ